MEYTKLQITKESGYAVVTVNNPPANTMSFAVLSELSEMLDEFYNDKSVRAIIVTSAGEKLFCAGADVAELAAMKPGEQPKVAGRDVFFKMERYPKPIIAAIQGSAYGGGLELALGCHLRIMSATAKLGLTEVKLGIMPGWGGTQRLTRAIGMTKALEFMLTGDMISSEEALRLNLVNKVVPANEVVSEAKALAVRLAQGAPISIREILNATHLGIETTIDVGSQIEFACARIVKASEDSKEGAKAFFEKRPPQYKGQ